MRIEPVQKLLSELHWRLNWHKVFKLCLSFFPMPENVLEHVYFLHLPDRRNFPVFKIHVVHQFCFWHVSSLQSLLEFTFLLLCGSVCRRFTFILLRLDFILLSLGFFELKLRWRKRDNWLLVGLLIVVDDLKIEPCQFRLLVELLLSGSILFDGFVNCLN